MGSVINSLSHVYPVKHAPHEYPALRPRKEDKIMDVVKDPWAGREIGMRCTTCIFFVPKGNRIDDNKGQFGRCRRNAPTLKGFVPVWGMDWCGEHRLDENKLL